MRLRLLLILSIIVIGSATYLLNLDGLTVRDAFVAGFALGGCTVAALLLAYRVFVRRSTLSRLTQYPPLP